MAAQYFESIAQSQNPFTETCFGLTLVFQDRHGNLWIEYQNEHGYTTQEKVSAMRLTEYCK